MTAENFPEKGHQNQPYRKEADHRVLEQSVKTNKKPETFCHISGFECSYRNPEIQVYC